jgi:hypothetical protein
MKHLACQGATIIIGQLTIILCQTITFRLNSLNKKTISTYNVENRGPD